VKFYTASKNAAHRNEEKEEPDMIAHVKNHYVHLWVQFWGCVDVLIEFLSTYYDFGIPLSHNFWMTLWKRSKHLPVYCETEIELVLSLTSDINITQTY